MAQRQQDKARLEAQISALEKRVIELEARDRERCDFEAELLAIAQSSTDFIMLIDQQGEILFINRALEEFDVDSVVGTSIYDYVQEHEHEVMTRSFEKAWSTGEPDLYTTMYHRSDGEILEFESRVTPVIRGGRVVSLIVTSSNMAERRRVLVERDQFFHLSIDMFCIATRDGRFKNLSPAFERSLGHADDALIGRPMVALVHPEDRADMAADLERLGSGELHVEFESRFLCADRTYKWLSWRAVLDAELDLVYAVARDVTERRGLENQLRQSQKMEAVGQLAGGIAHDFNNLVTAILLNAQRAQRDIEPHGSVYKRLDGIVDTCQRCAALTTKLLTFSRDQVLKLRTLDIRSLVEEIGSLVQRVLPENIVFTLSHSDELPAIRGDATQIEQIIVNLCVNARHAMPDGGRIELHAREVVLGQDECDGHPGIAPGRFVRLSVTDNGHGMSQEVQERAFEPFFTTKQPGEGTGLGLATVYGIVKQHDGLIKLMSEPGQGTRFEVYLPVSKRSMTASSPALRIPALGGSETLLVAEDESSLRAVLVEVLGEAGYRVIAAVDGHEAIDLFEAHRRDIDLVVLDMIMPKMGGVEAYEWISNLHPGMPVLFCSGYSKFMLHISDDNEPVPRLLSKPYDIQEMLTAVRAVLDARTSR